MNIDKIIKQLKAEKPQDNEEAEEQKDNIKNFTMLKEIKNKKVKTKADFKKAFSALCYGSITFCCDITKPCLSRNAVLNSLGISIKDYSKIKKKWGDEFIEMFVKNGK